MTPIPGCGAGVGRGWHEELAVLCIPVAWALLPPPSPAVGPPTMPCCARRGTQPQPASAAPRGLGRAGEAAAWAEVERGGKNT